MPDMSLQWEEVFLFFYCLQHSAEVRNIRKAQETHQKECKMNRSRGDVEKQAEWRWFINVEDVFCTIVVAVSNH